MRAIPPKGSIPPNIRGNRGIGNISLGFNIGGFGNKATPKQESGDFKIKGKAPVRTKKEQKISLENIKEWVIQELAWLLRAEKEGIAENINKKKWLLGFIPEILIEEIIKKAKKKAKSEK